MKKASYLKTAAILTNQMTSYMTFIEFQLRWFISLILFQDTDLGDHVLKSYYMRSLYELLEDIVSYKFPKGTILSNYKKIIAEIRRLENVRDDNVHAVWERTLEKKVPLKTKLAMDGFGLLAPRSVPVNEEMLRKMGKDVREMRKLSETILPRLFSTGFKIIRKNREFSIN